ncbi:hypothetical protein Bca52824_016142 [Brassica carinata]|uniref:Uncharacterized protein n=1 Tax=Brassica carinata TaxID=52824 RepID=A0A8X8B3T4_BRACI|nr:hypothetical protein Bca52824_016142 [Brassica carinata]
MREGGHVAANLDLVTVNHVENILAKLHEQDGSTNTEPKLMKLRLDRGNIGSDGGDKATVTAKDTSSEEVTWRVGVE